MQATLPFGLKDYATFENYKVGDNQAAVAVLQDLLTHNASMTCYLWGTAGSGKTHLLYSACKNVSDSIYVPTMNLDLQPAYLDSLEEHELICVDDIHSVAKQTSWERSLLSLLEKVESSRNKLIFTSNVPPIELNFALKDLVNRLTSRQAIKLQQISEKEKVEILIDRATRRGLRLEKQVIDFAIRRYSRDMHSLIRLLNRIDHASLTEHRRITIPFLKQHEGTDTEN